LSITILKTIIVVLYLYFLSKSHFSWYHTGSCPCNPYFNHWLRVCLGTSALWSTRQRFTRSIFQSPWLWCWYVQDWLRSRSHRWHSTGRCERWGCIQKCSCYSTWAGRVLPDPGES
jgi:hypothetical protein